jgi:hypothetical protein
MTVDEWNKLCEPIFRDTGDGANLLGICVVKGLLFLETPATPPTA